MTEHEPATDPQWVVFLCDGRRFGIPLERVSEIITPQPFTRLPGAGPEVCGLIGVRGRILTVVDLGVLLGLRPAVSRGDHRLLLLDLSARRIAAVVEEVATIATARLERDQPGTADSHTLGIGHAEDGVFQAVEPMHLLKSLLRN